MLDYDVIYCLTLPLTCSSRLGANVGRSRLRLPGFELETSVSDTMKGVVDGMVCHTIVGAVIMLIYIRHEAVIVTSQSLRAWRSLLLIAT
jgi:hypothetical protein